MIRTVLSSAICATILLLASHAAAEEGVLALVTEQVARAEGVQQAYWWQSGAEPNWSATDEALRSAFTTSGATFAEPATLGSLSKIYRRPTPSDSSAAAIASVFGHSRVLVGTVRYEPTKLRPLGLSGWKATVDVRLLERTSEGVSTVRKLQFDRHAWANTAEESRGQLQTELAEAIARSVAGSLGKSAGPVGVASDELLIGVTAPPSRAALEAVRGKLESLAGVSRVQERWAAEGMVVFEVNPGVSDPRTSIEQYVSFLMNEGAGRWTAVPEVSKWSEVVVFRLAERPQ